MLSLFWPSIDNDQWFKQSMLEDHINTQIDHKIKCERVGVEGWMGHPASLFIVTGALKLAKRRASHVIIGCIIQNARLAAEIQLNRRKAELKEAAVSVVQLDEAMEQLTGITLLAEGLARVMQVIEPRLIENPYHGITPKQRAWFLRVSSEIQHKIQVMKTMPCMRCSDGEFERTEEKMNLEKNKSRIFNQSLRSVNEATLRPYHLSFIQEELVEDLYEWPFSIPPF